MLKKLLIGIAILVLVAQLIRPEKNISTVPPGKEDFLVSLGAPPEIRQTFQTACYDCHSSNTRYPWYAEIQPFGWWLKRHVDDGKTEFNFSAFGTYTAKRQKSKLEAISDVIGDRSMPLKSYTWIHRDAIFTDEQIKKLQAWLEAAQDKVDEEK